jgi:uncharacterized repeat protein (TIGR03803 family)
MNQIGKTHTPQGCTLLMQFGVTMLLGLALELASTAQSTETTAQWDASGESAQAPIFRVLYAFTGQADGGIPGPVILDSAGNLYGTTLVGGDLDCLRGLGCGAVFKLDETGKETVLYRFTGGPDQEDPNGGLVRDAVGNLYGTTQGFNAGFGTVFKLDSDGEQTVLHAFTGGMDGRLPFAGVVRDAAGNLFGTTNIGGVSGNGTVFEVDADGKETILHSFAGGADGYEPFGGLVRDEAGSLYGTTAQGGDRACSCGTVFRLETDGEETVLHRFTGGLDGAVPGTTLVQDAGGNLYGTTSQGGGTGCANAGCGTVFKLDTTGKETVLYRFKGGADGAGPSAGLILDAAGNLYGATGAGGDLNCSSQLAPAGCGTVFKLDKSGKQVVLHAFERGTGGEHPAGTLARDAAGNLYGSAEFGGGAAGDGLVFKLKP